MNTNFKFKDTSGVPSITDDVQKHYLFNPCHFKMHKDTSHELSPIHMHNYMQLWYVLEGSFRHSIDNQIFVQKQGDFLFVPPFFPHQIDTSESQNVEFIFCDLTEGFLNIFPDSNEKETLFNLTYLRPVIMNAYHKNPFLSFTGKSKKQFENLFLELLNEYSNSSELSSTYLRTLIARLFTLITREYEAVSPHEEDALFIKYRYAIQDALDHIDTHFTENIHLKDICKIALMSVSSFSYVFKQITGKTFIEYVNYLRVRHACNLLMDTNRSLLNICNECGFYDLAYFSRIFKRILGYPPSTYRKNIKKYHIYD